MLYDFQKDDPAPRAVLRRDLSRGSTITCELVKGLYGFVDLTDHRTLARNTFAHTTRQLFVGGADVWDPGQG